MNKRQLILEDGTIFTGEAFGSQRSSKGEVNFHTGMTGYQEIISDPSYYGQIITMTYPSIGAYGVNRDDFESITPFINGIVVKEAVQEPSNFRNEETLDQFLSKHDIPGIAGIDTRKLTRLLRQKGSLKGMITDCEINSENVSKRLHVEEEIPFVAHTSITRPYIVPGRGKRIVIIDLGVKHSILHELTERHCHVTVVPYDYTVDEIERFKPDGVLISHGPGNPELLSKTIETTKSLLGLPMLGIGLGYQILALACRASVRKRKVGHYGSNFPIKELKTDKTWLTTLSQRYEVEEGSTTELPIEITYRSLNDGEMVGFTHEQYPLIAIQFNPEGAPGSTETNFIFDQFLTMIKQCKWTNGGLPHA